MYRSPDRHSRVLLVALLCLTSTSALAQRTRRSDTDESWLERCRDARYEDRERHCEIREKSLAAVRRIDVDGGRNGGAIVRGWERDEVLVRARIQTWAKNARDAREIADAITIRTADGTIRADGPSQQNEASWAVSYEVFVPFRTDLRLHAQNGGLTVERVEGRMVLETTNGGLTLREVAGDVRGETVNGGLHVELDGRWWRGEGLDVRTTNGGVNLSLPRNYSASLETGTVNGGVNIDFPITIQGSIGRRIATQLGSGGPLIRVTTTNGGVRIREIP